MNKGESRAPSKYAPRSFVGVPLQGQAHGGVSNVKPRVISEGSSTRKWVRNFWRQRDGGKGEEGAEIYAA